MSNLGAVNEAFKEARKQNDLIREVLKEKVNSALEIGRKHMEEKRLAPVVGIEPTLS